MAGTVKHTPGPWVITQYGDIEGPDGEVIRAKGIALTRGPEAEANSRLIAAAPEAHASLRAMTDWVKAALGCKEWHWDGDQREAAELELATALEVLAKAGGQA